MAKPPAAVPPAAETPGRAATEAIRARLAARLLPGARQKFDRGDVASALEEVQAHLTTHTNDTAHLFFRATLLARMGDLPPALQDLDAVIRNEPRWADAHLLKGELLYRNAQLADAVGHFRQARTLNPDDGLAPFMTHLCLALDGKPKEAAEWLAGMPLSRDHPAYYFMHATRAFMQGEAEKGRYLYHAALRLYPEEQTAPYQRAFRDQGWLSAD